ncbi:MAG: insulinase family protein, partial [Acidiferrobacterales bacterium]
MSATTSKLWQVFTEHLFPTTTYHYNSGGEPSDIPDLGYQQLRDFYKSHYHPSNAIFMTYGDIPVFDLQTRFQDNALSRFQKLDINIKVNDEKRFTRALSVTKSYALDKADADGDKTHIVVGWLLGKCTDPLELMRAHLLSSVLLDNGASPLRYALETSDLGSAPSPLCGLEDSNREMALMCGLEGSTAENAKAVEKLVLDVLKDVVENGISHEKLASVLHQLELQQREVSGDGYPYGLQLILEALPAAIHKGDPVNLLDLDKVLATLQTDITDPEFIKNLVRDWLLENPHRLCLTLVPDTDLSDKENTAEATKLAKIKAAMNDNDKQNVINLAAALAKRQEQEDDPEILPKVSLDDVPGDLLIPVGDKKTIGDFPGTCYAQGTNGLVYEQIIIDLPPLDDDLVQLLPIYTNCLAELGIGEKDYLYTQDWQDAVSGGISASTSMRGTIDDEQEISAYFTMSGRALVRNQDKLADLMQQMIEKVRFDESARIREVIAQMRAQSEQSVTGSGHMLAMSAASSKMSPAAALSHRLRGLQGIHTLKALDDSLDDKNKLAELQEKFQEIHQKILQSPRQFLVIGEAAKTGDVVNTLDKMWREKKTGSEKPSAFSATRVRDQAKQGWITSTQVNFCAKAYATVPSNHPDAAPLSVLSGFLRNGYLHRVIREQGGAYGGGAGHDTDNACFRFYSYRDPRLAQTLDDFDASIDWL